jgi:hypothetical protein
MLTSQPSIRSTGSTLSHQSPPSKTVAFNSKPDVAQVDGAPTGFKVGDSAMAHGLKQDKQLNGKVCTVTEVEASGLIHVSFQDIAGKAGKWKLTAKNLMPVMSMRGDSESDSEMPSDDASQEPSFYDDSDAEIIQEEIEEIEHMKPKDGEAIGENLKVVVRCSPKKANVSSLPKIGKKVGKKAHIWAVTIGNETFYARRTALCKVRLLTLKKQISGKIKKKLVKQLQKQGETRAKAMMRLAERITFQEQNANLWVMMHFGALF